MERTCRHDGHDHGRRRLLGGIGLIMAGAAATWSARPAYAATAAPIKQPASPTPAAFMARAEEMRRAAVAAGDQGFGAVVVKDGLIIGEGPSRVVTAQDPTAHAEMEAIRDAARRTGNRDLSGCVIYATFRPCRMCETGAYWANISRMYVGGGLQDAGPPRYGSC